MALGVNQLYNNYYTMRLNSLTTQHQVQSNRILLYTNEVTDIAERINFFEGQKSLTLATPDGTQLAIGAKYFDLPSGFDASDSDTWGDSIYYTTPCQKQLFIYKRLTDQNEIDKYLNGSTNTNDYYYVGNLQKDTTNGITTYYAKIPYTKGTDGSYDGGKSLSADTTHTGISYDAAQLAQDAADIQNSNTLSSKLMSGEYVFVYRNGDTGKNTIVDYDDLTFITLSDNQNSYQEMVERLEAERTNIDRMQTKVEQEQTTIETEIQAIQGMMESTEKVLTKNTESFKWGA